MISGDPVRRRVVDAARALEQARRAERAASDELSSALLEARHAGLSWADIAALTNLTERAAQSRAHRGMPLEERSPSERRRVEGSAATGTSDLPGVTIAEAARRLGVTRPTVYARIRDGRLRTVEDQRGRKWVLMDGDDV